MSPEGPASSRRGKAAVTEGLDVAEITGGAALDQGHHLGRDEIVEAVEQDAYPRRHLGVFELRRPTAT